MELTNSKEEIEQLQTEIFHLNKKLAHLRLVTPEDHHELIDRRPTGKATVMLFVGFKSHFITVSYNSDTL